MSTPLNYAPRTRRRGAPWWLWTLAALSVFGGFAWFCMPFSMSGRSEAARNAAARSDVRQLRLALDTLARDTGRYPTAAEGLGALIDPPPGLAGWQGPYVRRFPNDPWGRPYVYVPPTASPPPKGGPYVDFPAGPLAPQVLSLGPDGKQGSADDVGSR